VFSKNPNAKGNESLFACGIFVVCVFKKSKRKKEMRVRLGCIQNNKGNEGGSFILTVNYLNILRAAFLDEKNRKEY